MQVGLQQTRARNFVVDRLRRLWKRYTTNYVDIRDDKLSKLPRLSPVWDETTTARIDESDNADSVYSQDESLTIFDTSSMPSPSPQRRRKKEPNVSSASDQHVSTSPIVQYEIDFDYYERQSFTCGSLESIDSLAESYWDPDETIEVTSSQATPTVSNNIRSKQHQEFFAEHVRFLRIQTKPRKVEIIWSPDSAKEPSHS